jgi:hypothetical protein
MTDKKINLPFKNEFDKFGNLADGKDMVVCQFYSEYYSYEDEDTKVEYFENAAANAAHIVHCVNSHSLLVEALEGAKTELESCARHDTGCENDYLKWLNDCPNYQKVLKALNQAKL